MKRLPIRIPIFAIAVVASGVARTTFGIDLPEPPVLSNLTVTATQAVLRFAPYPAANYYRMLSGTNLGQPLGPDVSGQWNGFEWRGPAGKPSRFYRLEVLP